MQRLPSALLLLMLFPAVLKAQEVAGNPLLQAPKPSDVIKPQPESSAKAPTLTPEKRMQSRLRSPEATHRFWDKENRWLFAGVAATRALDFHSTGNMRRRGRDEILLSNGAVDDKPVFAAIEAAATLTSFGVSYLFHRTGHHKLERWTSVIHIGFSFGGAARNYALETRRRP